MDNTKAIMGNSRLAMPRASYFRLTGAGSYLNEWAESHYCTVNGYGIIKTTCIELPVKSEMIYF